MTLCSRGVNYFLPLPISPYIFWVCVKSNILFEKFPNWSENIYAFLYLSVSISLFMIVLLVCLEHSPFTITFLVLRILKINTILYIHTSHGSLSVSKVLFKTQSDIKKKSKFLIYYFWLQYVYLIFPTFVNSFCFHQLCHNLDLCRSLAQSLWGQSKLGSKPSSASDHLHELRQTI